MPMQSDRTTDQKQNKAIDEDHEQISGLHFQLHRVHHNLDVVTAMRRGLSPVPLAEANRIRT